MIFRVFNFVNLKLNKLWHRLVTMSNFWSKSSPCLDSNTGAIMQLKSKKLQVWDFSKSSKAIQQRWERSWKRLPSFSTMLMQTEMDSSMKANLWTTCKYRTIVTRPMDNLSTQEQRSMPLSGKPAMLSILKPMVLTLLKCKLSCRSPWPRTNSSSRKPAFEFPAKIFNQTRDWNIKNIMFTEQ